MESLTSKNENVKYLLCVIDVFTKYAWVKPLKDKKGKTVLNAFIKIVNDSNCKPNKLWVDQANIIYNKLIQEWLNDNDILMYSIHIADKSVIAERFTKTVKTKIYKIMTAKDSKLYIAYLNKAVDLNKQVIAKRFIKTVKTKIYKAMTVKDNKLYIAYLNKAVDQYNNSYYWWKRINSDYSALTEKIVMNHKAPKFINNDRVRITKYKNIFSKGYTENWSRETFIIDFALKFNHRAYKLKDLNGEKVIRSFYEKSCYWANYKWVIIKNQILILEIKSN